MKKLKILFLCTGNACRSQIAEGWARHLKGGVIDAFSAGVAPAGLHPDAVLVMKEAGVDISHHTSKHLDALGAIELDYVVTVCGNANDNCPTFHGKTKVVHVGFDDPPALAKTAKSREEALRHFRRVRDDIKRFVLTLPESLEGKR